jgi:hypothetical protein
MRWRNSIPAVIATAAVLTLIPPGFAQGRRGGMTGAPRGGVPARPSVPGNKREPQTPIDEFETMSPEERQKALNRLPPEQREKLQERLQRFNELPAEQQQALKNLYNRLHQLPPERQAAVRTAVGRFSEQSPQRQQAMREELQNMANLSDQERQGRMGSSEFRKKFNRKEQGIVRDMAPLLPSQ